MESLRALLHRHADELADCLAGLAEAAPKKSPVRKRSRALAIVPPPEREMTPERAARAETFARRALGR